MPIDPQRLAQIMQRMQLARQVGAAGGLPPSGEYNGGGDIVTPQPPMQMQQGGPPPGVPMQIQGVMSPMQRPGMPSQGGPAPGMAPRPMMPPGGMPPR